MTKTQDNSMNWSVRLGQYGIAAGSFGLLAGNAGAAVQPFAPPGGLPIVVDSTTNTSVDLDIDGDLVDDFRISYYTEYGGGFLVFHLNTGDANNSMDAYFPQTSPQIYVHPIRRFDRTEIVNEAFATRNDCSSTAGGGYHCTLDYTGDKTYRPFRDNPGFISLRLQADSGTGGMTPLPPRPAYLEVEVRNDGTELHILSGAYEDSNGTNRIRIPETGNRDALGDLAFGSD